MSVNPLTLSGLLGKVRGLLAEGFPGSYWIMAEILELHVNRSGHCYLELVEKKEDRDIFEARARGTIWASRYRMLRPYFESSTDMPLKSGLKILFRASVEFHPLYGFSLNLTDIDPAYTLGDLARKKQEVIRKLREEGVMDMNRELPIPAVPQRIAVISSETAAGYGDFIDSLLQNPHHYHVDVRLFQAVMQGNEAPASIRRAFDHIFAEVNSFDCVALIRGGGSKSDLECFNTYELAYYVTQFPLPVLTGIGHERDESVVDMVASRGLKTPTAVAEFLLDQFLAFEFRLSSLQDKLSKSVRNSVRDQEARLARMSGSLEHFSRRLIRSRTESLESFGKNLRKEAVSLCQRKREQLDHLQKRKELVDPRQILRRGYSMTRVNGRPLSDAGQASPGMRLETVLYKGKVISHVEKTSD